MRSIAVLALGAVVGLSAAAAAESSGPPDWEALAGVSNIEILTQDEDGDTRETTIWLAVLDGQGFIRTGSSRWGENVVRDPAVVLRIEGVEYPLRAEFIEDDSLRERIVAAFREKYGFVDGMLNFVRGSRPKIMHMLPR